MKPIVDPEFASHLIPLTDDEYATLEANVIRDGCRDALVVWTETGILLDGHNRLRICEEHGIEYRTVGVSLPDRDAAMDWIDANQLGRRNLTPDQVSLLRGRRYERMKKPNGVHGPRKLDQNDLASTADRLAAQYGVSAPTIRRDSQFARAVDALRDTVPDIDALALSGAVARKDVIDAAKEPETAAEKLSTHQLISQSLSNEWYTPQEYIDAARIVMGGIDLDPASNDTAQAWISAVQHYTVEDDGLAHEWHGRVWLNPPWGRLTGDFIAKLSREMAYDRVTEAVVLVNAHATDTDWFAPLWDGVLCFTDHRINYIAPNGTESSGSTHGSVFVYFGINEASFVREFAKWGAIVKRVQHDD